MCVKINNDELFKVLFYKQMPVLHWRSFYFFLVRGSLSVECASVRAENPTSNGARWPSGLERWLGMATGHSRPGSNPTSVKTVRFGTLAIPFTSLCQCISDETLKAVGPF